MLIRSVILLAAQLLGREELVEEITSGDGREGEVATLMRCYHTVENEIALDYFPLTAVDRFTPTDGKLLFTRFKYAPVHIKSVTSPSGMDISFEVFPAYLSLPTDCTSVDVTYTYVPAKKAISADVVFPEKISERLLAFGVASEYCIISRRYEEGKMWGERYRDALRAAGILRRPLSVRSRRWI